MVIQNVDNAFLSFYNLVTSFLERFAIIKSVLNSKIERKCGMAPVFTESPFILLIEFGPYGGRFRFRSDPLPKQRFA